MPVVASSSFMAASGSSLGDSLIVGVMGHLIPIVIEDTVDYFPTMNPHGGGFILADLDSLLRQLSILSPTANMGPNEVFIAEGPSAVDGVRDMVLSLSGVADRVHDRETLLESIRLDPMVTAGWRAMVLLSIGIIVFTAGLGYVTYLLSLARRSRIEMGLLRSLGLSHRQMTGLLSLEHLIVAIIGVGLGTWAGFQMSTLAVSSVAVTEDGQRVVPPFILMTDWSFMLPIYAALAAIFLATLYRLVHSMRHLDLQSIARTEGH